MTLDNPFNSTEIINFHFTDNSETLRVEIEYKKNGNPYFSRLVFSSLQYSDPKIASFYFDLLTNKSAKNLNSNSNSLQELIKKHFDTF